jgi:hypothetical protein
MRTVPADVDTRTAQRPNISDAVKSPIDGATFYSLHQRQRLSLHRTRHIAARTLRTPGVSGVGVQVRFRPASRRDLHRNSAQSGMDD